MNFSFGIGGAGPRHDPKDVALLLVWIAFTRGGEAVASDVDRTDAGLRAGRMEHEQCRS